EGELGRAASYAATAAAGRGSYRRRLVEARLDRRGLHLLDDFVDRCCGRPLPAQLDHGAHRGLGTMKHRLDRAVTPVAHPAGQTQTPGLIDRPAAIPDPLHPTLDPHAYGRLAHRRLDRCAPIDIAPKITPGSHGARARYVAWPAYVR